MHQNCFGASIRDRRPQIDPARKPGNRQDPEFVPASTAAKNWPPIASTQTRMIYVPANTNIAGILTGVPVSYTQRGLFTGSQSGGSFLNPGRITSARFQRGMSTAGSAWDACVSP